MVYVCTFVSSCLATKANNSIIISDHMAESGLFCFSLFLQTTVGIPVECVYSHTQLLSCVWEYTHSAGIPFVTLSHTHTATCTATCTV